MKMKHNRNELTVQEHAKELRNRILITVLVFILSFAVALYFSNDLLQLIMSLGKRIGYAFVYIAPQEIVIQQLKISGTAALIISVPILLYEVIMFVSPALPNTHMLGKVIVYVLIGLGMFVVGAAFSYFILLPFALQYFQSVGDSLGVSGQVSIKAFVEFVLQIVSAVAITFDFPLVTIFLFNSHLITIKFLTRMRPVIVVLMFLLAAFITPPDVLTQCIVALPMCALFELSIVICKVIERGHNGITDK